MKSAESVLNTSQILKEHENIRNKWSAKTAEAAGLRYLTPEEILQLEKNGNFCRDWRQIWVGENFDPSTVSGNIFFGRVVIEDNPTAATGTEKRAIPPGVYHSTLKNVWISGGCAIHRVQWLHDAYVGENAFLSNVQEIGGAPDARFFTENPVNVGMETGGREIYLWPEIDFPLAGKIALNRGDRVLQARYMKLAEDYQRAYLLPFTIIGDYCQIENCVSVKRSILAEGTRVKDGGLLDHCFTVCSTNEPVIISNGGIVSNSLLQFGVHVSGNAHINNSLLCEHCEVERHGIVVSSVLAPNCSIAEGEITSSLVGPFVAAHHQSLLIAAIWPEGKGNIGYGANVGSNHTGKAPDQEIWCGEGGFYGLGTNIKFPSNFQGAPYSIIATAVDTLPQKVDFPFSLINKPATFPDGISPAFNEISPAWVLSENLYAIIRNEKKYAKRNKAAHTVIETRIFRPDIVDRMWNAAQRLEIPAEEQIQEIYTEKQIAGLGKNFMRERARREAVRTYRYFCRYYVLKGVWNQVKGCNTIPGWEELFAAEATSGDWQHQKEYIQNGHFQWSHPREALADYAEILKSIGERLLNSKKKDDGRGMKIIPDYKVAATPAENDPFIRETLAEFEEEISLIGEFL